MPKNNVHDNRRDDSFTLPAGAVPDLDDKAYEVGAVDSGYEPPEPAARPKKSGSSNHGPVKASASGKSAAQPKPRFVSIEEFCALPPSQSWTIRHYLEPDTICVLYGESQSYKSFISIDLICHVATGRPWRGNRTKEGLCLYIAGEGGNGLSRRFKAWFQYHQEAMRNISVSTVPLELCDPVNVDALIADTLELLASLQQTALVICIDTLSTHFGGFDENRTQDMRAFMQGIRRLRMETGATILIVHHVGHGNKERERGSISLGQDSDWRYQLERSPGTTITSLFNKKSKDARMPDALSWNLVSVELPWLEEGDEEGTWVPMSSLVAVPVEAQPEQPKPEFLPKSQRVAMDALRAALMQHGVEDKGVVSVAEDQWREAAYAAGISSGKQEAKQKAFVRTSKELVSAGKVSCHEGRFWVPKPTRTKPDKTGHCPGTSTGCGEVKPDKAGHISLDMSGCVWATDNPPSENGEAF